MATEHEPREGTIVISWKRVDGAQSEPSSFDWDLRLDPPGLSDEDLSRLLAEVAERT
jgi:hypothetical protein